MAINTKYGVVEVGLETSTYVPPNGCHSECPYFVVRTPLPLLLCPRSRMGTRSVYILATVIGFPLRSYENRLLTIKRVRFCSLD